MRVLTGSTTVAQKRLALQNGAQRVGPLLLGCSLWESTTTTTFWVLGLGQFCLWVRLSSFLTWSGGSLASSQRGVATLVVCRGQGLTKRF